jgi:hypothetical protein
VAEDVMWNVSQLATVHPLETRVAAMCAVAIGIETRFDWPGLQIGGIL